MKPFLGLLKKDGMILQFWYMIWFVLSVGGMIIAFFFSKNYDEPLVTLPIIFFLFFFHLYLMPLMMLSMLRIEGKTQIWLHNPQSSYQLFFSKLCVVFGYQMISQLLVNLYFLLLYKWYFNEQIVQWFVNFKFKHFLFLNGFVLATALYFSLWVIFLWTVYHSLSKYPALKHLRWLAVVLIIGAYHFLGYLSQKFGFNDYILGLWKVEIYSNMAYENGIGLDAAATPLGIPVSSIIYYVIICIILFFVAGKLLDRKVEV